MFCLQKQYLLAESESFARSTRSTTANEFNRTDQNIAGHFFTEVVDILVNKGNLVRGHTETLMAQRVHALLRQEFCNVAQQLASDCFNLSSSLPDANDGADLKQLNEVTNALQEWAHAESIESSQSVADVDIEFVCEPERS